MLRRNALLLLFGVALCLALTGCPPRPETTVTGVTITPDLVVLDVGGNAQLSARVHGTGSPSQTVAWRSEDEYVATVSEAGLVTAIAEGQTTITATSADDPSHDATATVHATSDQLTAFEERFVMALARERTVVIEEEDFAVTFVPALFPVGLDLSAGPDESVPLGVWRIAIDEDAEAAGGDETMPAWMHDRYIFAELVPDPDGESSGGRIRFSDLLGNEVFAAAPQFPVDIDLSLLEPIPMAPAEDHPDTFTSSEETPGINVSWNWDVQFNPWRLELAPEK